MRIFEINFCKNRWGICNFPGECGNIDIKCTFDFDLWFRIGKLWRFIKYQERNFVWTHNTWNWIALLYCWLWRFLGRSGTVRLRIVGIRLVVFVSPYIKHFKYNTITSVSYRKSQSQSTVQEPKTLGIWKRRYLLYICSVDYKCIKQLKLLIITIACANFWNQLL